MPDPDRPFTTTDAGIPAASDEYSLTVGPGRSGPAAGHLPGPEDAAVQPRAGPRAGGPRQGRGRLRVLRGHRGRVPVHPGRPVRQGHPHRDAGPVLHRGRGAGLRRHRPATPGASRSSSTPRTATTTWSATTRRSSSSGTPRSSRTSSTPRSAGPTTICGTTTCSGTSGRCRRSRAHQVTWLMGDRGLPKTWRHMNGYSSHTYMWINAGGERSWVKYHFKTDQGVEHLTEEEGAPPGGGEPRPPPRGPLPGHRLGGRPHPGRSTCRSCPSRTPPTTASTPST